MQPDATNDQTETRTVSVAEAARALGISSEAVRMRLRRDSLDGYRDGGGRWWVRLPAATQRATEPDRMPGPATAADGGPATASPASREGIARDTADPRAERDRLLAMVETVLAERRDQPPTVLSSLRRLVATLTDWAIARLRRDDAAGTDAG